ACLETILVGRTETNPAIKTAQCCFLRSGGEVGKTAPERELPGANLIRPDPPVILICDSLSSGCRAVGRTREAVDLPDLPGEGDHVSFLPDELERGRLVQTVHDHGKGAVPVDLDERAGVRHRKIQRFSSRVERAEREGVKGATEAKLQVKHPRGAGGYVRSGGRIRPE